MGAPPSEILLQLGPFSLRWYGLLIGLGLLAGAWVASREATRRGLDPNHVYNALLVAVPLALVGARLYHVIDQWEALYAAEPLRALFIWQGGIGIYGAIAGSILGVVIYLRWQRLPLWPWLDVGAPGLILGQAIGRWGNYFNQELYGQPTDLPWGLFVDPFHRLPGYEEFERFHPLFLYESLWNLLGCILLLIMARRFAGRLRDGEIALGYLIYYPLGRFFLEMLRIENWRIAGIPTAQIVGAILILGAIALLVYRRRQPLPTPVAASSPPALAATPPPRRRTPPRRRPH